MCLMSKSIPLTMQIIFALFAFWIGSVAPSPKDSYQVYLFLLEDCMITQAYTDKLQEIHDKYESGNIRFTGYFPNPVSTDSTMQSFVQKYNLPFPCTMAGAYDLAKCYGVTVTPEVVVYNETRDSVYYQGRIDNLFERVGQRRVVVTSSELEAALKAIQNNKPVTIPRTTAVGCFLK